MVATRGCGGARAVRRTGPQSKSSGRKQRGGAVEQGKEQCGVTVDGGAGRKAGVAERRGATGEGAGGVTIDGGAGRGGGAAKRGDRRRRSRAE